MPGLDVGGAMDSRVSIRARHCWRAMRLRDGVRAYYGWFQSAPAIAGGRCSRLPVVARDQSRFNPRPPLLAGDAWDIFRDHSPEMFQSAPAIAGGRCPPGTSPRCAPGSFNPRPPLLAGDASAGQTAHPPSRVSIRARHCWRAMHGGGLGAGEAAAFQSAPAIAGGRCRCAASKRSA